MKLISLNCWGGKIYKPLMKFIKEQAKDTDIFCLQEVFNTPTKNLEKNGYRLNLYQELTKILKDFQGYYAPTQSHYVFLTGFVGFDLSYGLAIFIRKNIKVKSVGDFFVFGKRDGANPQNLSYTLPRNLQHLTFSFKDKPLTISNLHGIWFPGPKIDTPLRIEQSKKAMKFLDKREGEKILVGDFNLRLNTKSVKILEKHLRNLVKEYNILTTRNKLYDRTDDKFADYVFISSGLEVKDFKLPSIEISDHLPLILEFS